MAKMQVLIKDAQASIATPTQLYRQFSAQQPCYFRASAFVVFCALVVVALKTLSMLLEGGLATALSTFASVLIIYPVVSLLGLTLLALVLYPLLRLLGSQQPFVMTYSATAFLAASIAVVCIISSVIAWFWIVGLVWLWWLLVVMAVEVHGASKPRAMIVMAVICVLIYALFGYFCNQSKVNDEISSAVSFVEESGGDEANIDRQVDGLAADEALQREVSEPLVGETVNYEEALLPDWAEAGLDDDSVLPKTTEALDALVNEFGVFASTMADEVKTTVGGFAEEVESAIESTLAKGAEIAAPRRQDDSSQSTVNDGVEGDDLSAVRADDAVSSRSKAEKLGEVVGSLVNALNRTADQLNSGFNEGMQSADPAELDAAVQQAAEKTGKTIGSLIQIFENAANEIDRTIKDNAADQERDTEQPSK